MSEIYTLQRTASRASSRNMRGNTTSPKKGIFDFIYTMVRPNKGIFPSFASELRNFTNKGMSKFPLFGQKSCENWPISAK